MQILCRLSDCQDGFCVVDKIDKFNTNEVMRTVITHDNMTYNCLDSLVVDLSTSEDHLNKLIREWVHMQTRLSKSF